MRLNKQIVFFTEGNTKEKKTTNQNKPMRLNKQRLLVFPPPPPFPFICFLFCEVFSTSKMMLFFFFFWGGRDILNKWRAPKKKETKHLLSLMSPFERDLYDPIQNVVLSWLYQQRPSNRMDISRVSHQCVFEYVVLTLISLKIFFHNPDNGKRKVFLQSDSLHVD